MQSMISLISCHLQKKKWSGSLGRNAYVHGYHCQDTNILTNKMIRKQTFMHSLQYLVFTLFKGGSHVTLWHNCTSVNFSV